MSLQDELRDLRRALYGADDLRQEGDIPQLRRVQNRNSYRLTRLEWGVLALLATGLARGAGELAAWLRG